MKNIKVKHLFWSIIFLTFLTMLNTCNSCQSNNNNKKLQKETDSLIIEVEQLQMNINNFNKNIISNTDLEIQGLKTEKRMLINTNQIFLTKLRPDKRVLEIDKEIKKLEKKRDENK